MGSQMAPTRASKRKRCEDQQPSGDASTAGPPRKKTEANNSRQQLSRNISHPLLSQLYPNLQTLRSYVLSRLPASSRLRRKKIASVGLQDDTTEKTPTDPELAVARLLDTTVVGHAGQPTAAPDNRWEQWTSFSQKGDESYVSLSGSSAGGGFSQSEIVDFVVWLLFSREKKGGNHPKHLLCDGFRKDFDRKPRGRPTPGHGQIPGLFSFYVNNHVRALKDEPWPQLLLLFGKSGEAMMLDLLLDCAIFSRVAAGRDNYHQLSGIPVSELDCSPTQNASPTASRSSNGNKRLDVVARAPSEISLIRSRMLYARAALNARGLVHFGLRHIHVLNRFPLQCHGSSSGQANEVVKHEDATIRVAMYMFPRQFGLHNVFTSQVDHNQTAQKFQDYTLREEEITRKYRVSREGVQQCKAHIPKRLRGLPLDLVRKLQVLHARCSYSMLLQHYCPTPGQSPRQAAQASSRPLLLSTKSQQKSTKSRKKTRPALPSAQPPRFSTLVELATPTAKVSAFCQAVLTKTIPNEFWGNKEMQHHNRDAFLKKVDHFVRLRRFEQLSLHELIQDLKITDMDWLVPPNLRGGKCSLLETQKRVEILLEFVYYIFDSILIPLIRSNFYVTESNVHKYRLFFFRHDTWRYVAEPAMASLKTTMFEEVKLDDAMRILDARKLGFSQVRLLPKGLGMRPIMNLRRRTLVRGNKKLLGPSINNVLAPVGSMLKLERTMHPQRLGSAMFSVGDIYKRLKDFKSSLGSNNQPLYLAKVDVQGAFDSIPQRAILQLMSRVPTEREYKLVKHVEVKPGEKIQTKAAHAKPLKKWQTLAKAPGDQAGFGEMLDEQLAASKRNTVFVESVVSRTYNMRSLMALMATHIQDNLVKIGKKYYRQKNGIPQGSVLSSTLCNYFYADLEQNHLSFLGEGNDSLLLRLIDDFLLITTDRSKAVGFVETMHAGVPDYGVTVNPDKTLVTFAMSISGQEVPQLEPGRAFPYCGTLIDPQTLAMGKNREPANKGTVVVFDSLTVEYGRHPGQTFKRKVLNAFKIQSHLMFYDTAHNSLRAVLSGIYGAYVETASKTWAYARCLPHSKRPSAALVVAAIRELVVVSYLLLASRERKARYPGYKCAVKKQQMAWLAMVAFRTVLGRKQAGYGQVLGWLDGELERLGREGKVDVRALARAVRNG